jgi:hypothetical protein
MVAIDILVFRRTDLDCIVSGNVYRYVPDGGIGDYTNGA